MRDIALERLVGAKQKNKVQAILPKAWYGQVFIIVFTLVLVLILLAGTGTALAAAGYDLSCWTVSGGGGASSGSGYSLNGAAGQPAAGELSGTGFHLSGGFWVGSGATGSEVYLPLIVK